MFELRLEEFESLDCLVRKLKGLHLGPDEGESGVAIPAKVEHQVHGGYQRCLQLILRVDQSTQQFLTCLFHLQKPSLQFCKGGKLDITIILGEEVVDDFVVLREERLRVCGPSQCADDLVAAEEGDVLGGAGGTSGTRLSLMKSPSMILVMQYSPIELEIDIFFRFSEL